MAWSPKQEGLLISGSDDKKVCMWDISSTTKGNGKEADATATFLGHQSVVEDVQFHCHNPDMFGSCGDDKLLMLWDRRDATKAQQQITAHDAFVNCLSFNPNSEYLIATGSVIRTSSSPVRLCGRLPDAARDC